MLSKLTHWPSLLFVFILTACGGSEQGPYVTDIQANQLAYGKLSTFTLTGASLNKGVALSVTGCSNLKQDASSTAHLSRERLVAAVEVVPQIEIGPRERLVTRLN